MPSSSPRRRSPHRLMSIGRHSPVNATRRWGSAAKATHACVCTNGTPRRPMACPALLVRHAGHQGHAGHGCDRNTLLRNRYFSNEDKVAIFRSIIEAANSASPPAKRTASELRCRFDARRSTPATCCCVLPTLRRPLLKNGFSGFGDDSSMRIPKRADEHNAQGQGSVLGDLSPYLSRNA